MADYVICASCGARMKAERRWCLKCDMPLVGAVDWTDPTAQRDRRVVAATVVSLFLLTALALVWEARTVAPPDDTAHPVKSVVTKAPSRPAGGTTP